MKKIWLSVLGLIALGAAPADAADLAARHMYTKAAAPMVAPVFNWGGFYIGLNGGGGSAHKCWDLLADPFGDTGSEGCHDATGGTVGGQIGYRWQASNWVFGVEGQGNWANFKGSRLDSLAGKVFVHGLTDESKIDAFGLITGQVGYAWNNLLVYVKGGAAVVGDKYDTFIVPSGLAGSAASETRWGGTAGAGLEYGFTPNWSVGVEYDHLFLGGRDIRFTDPTGLFVATSHISQDADMGLVRVNYRWGGPVVARY